MKDGAEVTLRYIGSLFHRPAVCGKQYIGKRIWIEFADWRDCEFHDCEVIVSGSSERLTLECCRFDACDWRAVGDARRTIGLLKALSAQKGGDEIVRRTFPMALNHSPAKD